MFMSKFVLIDSTGSIIIKQRTEDTLGKYFQGQMPDSCLDSLNLIVKKIMRNTDSITGVDVCVDCGHANLYIEYRGMRKLIKSIGRKNNNLNPLTDYMTYLVSHLPLRKLDTMINFRSENAIMRPPLIKTIPMTTDSSQ
jgi:hypothetical protein